MDEKRYKEITSKIVPGEDKLKNGIITFLVGGSLGLIAEVIVNILENNFNFQYKDATSFMIVIFIFISCLLTALGKFDNLVSKARAGLIVPITGFAHAMTSSMIDYKKEGFVTGIGSNAFKLAGSVILYGVISAYVFGFLRYVIFGG